MPLNVLYSLNLDADGEEKVPHHLYRGRCAGLRALVRAAPSSKQTFPCSHTSHGSLERKARRGDSSYGLDKETKAQKVQEPVQGHSRA